jgi:hypothetical protein
LSDFIAVIAPLAEWLVGRGRSFQQAKQKLALRLIRFFVHGAVHPDTQNSTFVADNGA